MIEGSQFLELLFEGFRAIGAGLVGLIQTGLGHFNLVIPEWMIEVATIVVLLFLVFRYGKLIGKVLVVVLLLMLASTLLELFTV